MVHILSCLWYLTARYNQFSIDTWVAVNNSIDNPASELYIDSVYYVFMTLATVGAGDIVPRTKLERVFAISLMVFGVGLYSNLISNMSILLGSEPSFLTKRTDMFNDLSKATNLPSDLTKRVIEHYHHTSLQENQGWHDRDQLLSSLPFYLHSEVSLFMHHKLVSEVYFFQDKSPDFIAEIVPRLQPLYMKEWQLIYEENTFADEVCFLRVGRVELVKQGVEFVTYVSGSYFGELDVLWGRLRETSARTRQVCELLILRKTHFLRMLEKYPEVQSEVVDIAHIRQARNDRAYLETQGFLKASEMQAYLHSPPSSHRSVKKEIRKGTSWSVLKRENNRTRWETMNSMDVTNYEKTTSLRHKNKENSSVLLVSAQQRFVPMELEARLGFVRRKKKALIDKSIAKQLPAPPEIRELVGLLKRYEAVVSNGALRIEQRLNQIETLQEDLAELTQRL